MLYDKIKTNKQKKMKETIHSLGKFLLLDDSLWLSLFSYLGFKKISRIDK